MKLDLVCQYTRLVFCLPDCKWWSGILYFWAFCLYDFFSLEI